jgi:hypothetical protein
MNFKNRSHIEFPFIWLGNLQTVGGTKPMFLFKIFILPPPTHLSPLSLCRQGRPQHSPPPLSALATPLLTFRLNVIRELLILVLIRPLLSRTLRGVKIKF